MSTVRTLPRSLAALSTVLLVCVGGLAACAVGSSSSDVSTGSEPTEPISDADASSENLKAPAPGTSGTDAGAKDASTKDSGTKADSGSGGATTSCPGYATPTQSAACDACGSKPCQANGCYNGYYCNLSTSKCSPKPASCP